MAKLGDLVEFYLPDGKQRRVGRYVRKQDGYCFVVCLVSMYRRVYKLRLKEIKTIKEDK